MAFGKEFTKTFSQLKSSMKNEDGSQQNTDKSSSTSATAEVGKEQEEKYLKSLNKAENDYSGKLINAVTLKNRKANYINQSKAVRAMEMKEPDDAFTVIEEIREGQAVLLIFDDTDKHIQQKILDRVYGACHYSNICVEKLKATLLLIDPQLKQ